MHIVPSSDAPVKCCLIRAVSRALQVRLPKKTPGIKKRTWRCSSDLIGNFAESAV